MPPEYIIGSRICLSIIRQGAHFLGEYRRWISYVYGYLNGVKGQSAGYVKIESRNGMCKIYTNIKAPYSTVTSIKIYVFYRQDDRMVLVELGTGNMKKGQCEFTYETREGCIGENNLRLEQLGGLVGVVDESHYFGTVWDDKEINMNNAIKHSEQESENIVQNKLLDIMGEDVDRNNIGVTNIKNSKEINVKNENKSVENTYLEKINDEETNTEEGNNKRINIKGINTEELSLGKINGEEINVSKLNTEESDCKDMIQDNLVDNELNEFENSSFVERIFARYPGMYPFEDDEIIECVKLDPQDIGVLPMEKWVLANNSFLLHGYYTYRHLIFAKVRGEDLKDIYILGVPGLYRDRERFMASMFGFDKFKGVRGTPRDYGEFGYWYMNLEL